MAVLDLAARTAGAQGIARQAEIGITVGAPRAGPAAWDREKASDPQLPAVRHRLFPPPDRSGLWKDVADLGRGTAGFGPI